MRENILAPPRRRRPSHTVLAVIRAPCKREQVNEGLHNFVGRGEERGAKAATPFISLIHTQYMRTVKVMG